MPSTTASRSRSTGTVHYTDDFGDCREGCTRHHDGNDLIGAKLDARGRGERRHDRVGARRQQRHAGNMLKLTGTDGWDYWYIHINNDTPGTDDGKNPAKWRFAPGITSART